ncbi:MAG: hypothetical protein ACNS60_00725 [Candidatus Cyclobacteriaceae bacterium M2_1C_046]
MNIAVIIVSLVYGLFMATPAPPCNDLKVEVEVTHTTDGLSNGSVKVKVEGGKAPYLYIYFNTKGKPISYEYTESSIKDLKSGTYFCTIYDKNDCQIKKEIKIK